MYKIQGIGNLPDVINEQKGRRPTCLAKHCSTRYNAIFQHKNIDNFFISPQKHMYIHQKCLTEALLMNIHKFFFFENYLEL